MPIVLVAMCCVLGAMLLGIGLVKRWKRTMDVSDDTQYVETLATLCANSVRRHFNPYTDIDWEAPEFSVTPDDPRWVLSATDPLGRHPWYTAQPLQKQIAIGMWRHAKARSTIQTRTGRLWGLVSRRLRSPRSAVVWCGSTPKSQKQHSLSTTLQRRKATWSRRRKPSESRWRGNGNCPFPQPTRSANSR
jgi:hypothetical protein